MQGSLWASNALHFYGGIHAHAGQPKTLKFLIEGFLPVQASKGVIPSKALWGLLF